MASFILVNAPGEMALTVTPCLLPSRASESVTDHTAALAAPYPRLASPAILESNATSETAWFISITAPGREETAPLPGRPRVRGPFEEIAIGGPSGSSVATTTTSVNKAVVERGDQLPAKSTYFLSPPRPAWPSCMSGPPDNGKAAAQAGS